jgi:hypothetical protein
MGGAEVSAAADERAPVDGTGVGSVAEKLEGVRSRIHAAGVDPGAVRIVAVTKGFGPDACRSALAAGLVDLGENYAAELLAKADALGPGSGARWHAIGGLQRNKVAPLSGRVALWQTLDRSPLAAELARRAPGAEVLLQVNLAADPSRPGCRFDGAPALLDEATGLGLSVRGVMGVAPLGPPEDVARVAFRRLAGLAARLGLPEVSMGMSADFEIAVQEGATMLRLGTALFGSRPPRRASRPVR